ncbi:MAG: aldehyde dehydrogenase family protein [Candidatus Bipolaricaulia bacterium]
MSYHNWINGAWVDAHSAETFESISPANNDDSLGDFPRSTQDDVEAAVEAADEAFQPWRKTPAPERGEILFRVARLLDERQEELAQLMTREMGKVLNETRGDVQEAIDMGYYLAAEGRRLHGYTTTSELPNKFNYAKRRPIGRIAMVTPWNFPIAVPSWKLFPALVAGNTAVWKPSEDSPRVAVEFCKIFEEAGLPNGVLNLVTGYGEDAGAPLVKHPKIDMVSFTGSVDVGRQIYQVAAEKLNKVHLEMGGKNPVVALADADVDLAVEGIAWSAFGTTGQRCTACSRLIAHEDVHDELVDKLITEAENLTLGDGLDDSTDVGPVVNRGQLKRIHDYVQLGVKEGANLVTGGEIAEDGDLANGTFYRPTIFTGVTPDMRIFHEEIFGPVLAVTKARDYDEAMALANDPDYGLSASVYTNSVFQAHRFLEDIEAGITYVNSGTIGSEVHLPFGGVKSTGNGGREAGESAIDEYTDWQAVYVDYSGELQKAQGLE